MSRSVRSDSTPTVDVRSFLLRQSQDWLVDELLRAAEEHPLVAARLQVLSGASRAEVLDLSDVRRDLAAAIEPVGFVEYAAAGGYAQQIERVLDEVRQLIDKGFPEAAVEAAAYALELLEEAMGYVDDSDGHVGACLVEAQEIHLAACEQAQLDPVELGEQLADWALRSEWEVFLDSPITYADVLGELGLARFEEMVDEQWSTLPRLQPGDQDSWDARRFRPASLKKALAHRRGVDAVVEVMAHDLASPYQFWRIADLLAGADRVEDAMQWLVRGRASFPGDPDPRLVELLAELHTRAGRPDLATDLARQLFDRRPSLAAYQRLHGYAVQAGTWPERRAEALTLLRGQPKITVPDVGNRWHSPPGHSTLVQVLLWEDDVNAAWQAAQEGGCRPPLWLELARRRAEQHPADAIPILQREILAAVDGAQRAHYRTAAGLAGELRRYADRAEQGLELDEWIRSVRMDNRRRRALQDEFDQAGLPR